MSKLLDPNNIRHHKRVNVNKHQRKKQVTIVDKLIFKVINVVDAVTMYYDDLAARRGMYRFHYKHHRYYCGIDYGFYKYQLRSHKIIWDNTSRTSARIMIKTANGYRFIKDRWGDIRHFTKQELFKQY